MTETGVLPNSLLVHMLVLVVIYISGTHENETTNLSLNPVEAFENTNVTLTCSYSGPLSVEGFIWVLHTSGAEPKTYQSVVANNCQLLPGILGNKTVYSYSCVSNTRHSVVLRNIKQHNHGEVWKCGSVVNDLMILSNNVTVLVTVPITTLTIGPYINQLTERENTSLSLQCTTSVCRPKPKFLWYKGKTEMTDGNEILLSEAPNNDVPGPQIQSYTNSYSTKLTRELNGWYLFCAADNHNSSYVLSNKIFLNVTYPPDGAPRISSLSNKGEFNVIQNDIVHLECSTTGGNPLPKLELDKYNESPQQINGSRVTKIASWQATGRDPVDLTCQSFHTHRNDYVAITIKILYPPDTPEISIETSTGLYVNVIKTVSVIEGKTFKLNCSAISNPPVSIFKWNGLKTDLSNFYTTKADRNSETISCYVSNEMQVSDSRSSVVGYNITHLNVNVLYPPAVNTMTERTVLEGNDVVYPCNFVPGNPSVTNITWSWNGTNWNDHFLIISNVSRHHAGVYRCDVQNLMVSSDGTKEFGNASGEFSLLVEPYKNDKFSPQSSNVSVVAASVAGTVVGVVFLAALIIILMFYRRRKRLSYQKRDVSIQYYNFNNSKVNETQSISTKVDNANSYEAFQHTGSDRQYDSLSPEDCKKEKKNDCQISTEGGNLHVYERLQTKGFDKQCETISPNACHVKIEQHTVYENLQ